MVEIEYSFLYLLSNSNFYETLKLRTKAEREHIISLKGYGRAGTGAMVRVPPPTAPQNPAQNKANADLNPYICIDC